MSPACTSCGQGDKTVQHALAHCPEISDMIVYAEHVLLHLERIQLSAECMIKIALPPGLLKEEEACLLCTVAVLKGSIWKTKMKKVATRTWCRVMYSN